MILTKLMNSFREGIQWEHKHNDFIHKPKICSKVQYEFQNLAPSSFSIPLPSSICHAQANEKVRFSTRLSSNFHIHSNFSHLQFLPNLAFTVVFVLYHVL